MFLAPPPPTTHLPVQGQVWDNCNGNNFYHRISQLPSGVTRGPVPPVKPSAVHTLEEVAKRQASQLFFTYPERPVAGQQGFMLCVNRINSDLLRDCPNVKLHYGFNNWEVRGSEIPVGTTHPRTLT